MSSFGGSVALQVHKPSAGACDLWVYLDSVLVMTGGRRSVEISSE